MISKNQVYRKESSLASKLAIQDQHTEFGFNCLNFAVSESSGFIKIKIHNKGLTLGARIGVRTIVLPDGALPEKDFDPIDEIIEFSS